MLTKKETEKFSNFLATEDEQIKKYQKLLQTYDIDTITMIFLKNYQLERLFQKINEDIIEINSEQTEEIMKQIKLRNQIAKLSNRLLKCLKIILSKRDNNISNKIKLLEFQKELFIKYQNMYVKFEEIGDMRIDAIINAQNNSDTFSYQQLSSYVKRERKIHQNITYFTKKR